MKADSQRLLINFALIVADSAWVYVTLGALGVVGGQTTSPLSWPWVLLLLFAGALTEVLCRPAPARQLPIGIVCIYVAAAAALGPDRFDLGWPLVLVTGGFPAVDVIRLLIALGGGAWAWNLGTAISAEPFPNDRAVRHFRLGVLVLAGGLIAQVSSRADLGVATMMVPFFAASLTALALTRFPDASRAGRRWGLVVFAAAGVAIGAGLAAVALLALLGRGGAQALASGWSSVARLFTAGLELVLAPLAEGIIRSLRWLLSLFGKVDSRPAEPVANYLTLAGGDAQSAQAVAEALQYPVFVLLAYVLYRLLRPALRRFYRRDPPRADLSRESIDTSSGLLADLGWFLRALFGSGSGEDALRWIRPSEPGRIADAMRLYFDMLDRALHQGFAFVPGMTPRERISGLNALLPGAPVESITECFNHACYGRTETDPAVLDRLRHGLESATRDLAR